MRYSLRQLEVFLAIAMHGNITKAADQLAMSQSAASDSLKELESRLDIQLFERAGKRLKINSRGKALQEQAQDLIERAVVLEENFLGTEVIDEIKVGATLTIGNYMAVPIIAAFRAKHRQARVSLKVSNTERIADMVASFKLDIGLIEGEINREELEFIPIQEDELVVFCAPDHPLAKTGTLSDEDLIHAEWIVREAGSGTRQTFERAMQGIFPQLDFVLELQNMESTKKAVQAGLGIACLSRVTIREELHNKELIELAVPHRDFSRQFYAVLHKNKHRSTTIEEWLHFCRQPELHLATPH